MIPESIASFFAGNHEALWLTTLLVDLAGTVLLYRLFGKAGLQVAIATAIILAICKDQNSPLSSVCKPALV